MLPHWENGQVVLPVEHGTGNWIGAASALTHGDYIYLAYRDRHPIDKGRGNRAYVARSSIDDGIHCETLCAIDKEDMDAESLERPALDVTTDGGWFLYLSCATFNSKHWRIERLSAYEPGEFSPRTRQVVFPGSADFGIKDPVILRGSDLRIWATRHPLTEGAENADQMTSVVADTGDPVMVPEPGTWYSRGTRITAVVGHSPYFDGPPSPPQNSPQATRTSTSNATHQPSLDQVYSDRRVPERPVRPSATLSPTATGVLGCQGFGGIWLGVTIAS